METDDHGEPTGVLREESAWHFRDTYVKTTDDEYVDAMRAGVKLANARGVTAVHDKDGWLGALRLWQRLRAETGLSLRVWQSLPHAFLDELEAIDFSAGLGDDWLRAGYLKTFMDGTLGSQTARMLDGSGVQITSREELEEVIRRGARIGWPVAVHAIGDLANREALDAFEATRDEWAPRGLRPRIEHGQCLAPEDVPRFAARRRGVGAVLARAFRPRPRRSLLGGQDRRHLRVPLAARVGRRRRERVGRADRGARAARGNPRRRPPHDRRASRLASRAGGDGGAGARGDLRDARVADRRRAAARQAAARLSRDLVVLSTDPTVDLEGCEVVATMAGGRWVHNPPPWD